MPGILIIPSVSAGNVPQLALDLLIYTLGAHYVGQLDGKYLYPFVGPRDRPETESTSNHSTHVSQVPPISLAAEIFTTENKLITLIQLRSPTLPGSRAAFVNKTLIPYIESTQPSEVLVVGSSNAGMQLHIDATNRIKLFTDNNLSERLSALSLNDPNSTKKLPIEGVPRDLAESGFVLDILSAKGTKTPSSALVMFTYEGDNFPDAEELASKVVDVIDMEQPKEWIRPQSWKGAYGRQLAVGLEEGMYS